jgi:hypothetical protein
VKAIARLARPQGCLEATGAYDSLQTAPSIAASAASLTARAGLCEHGAILALTSRRTSASAEAGAG